MACRCRRLGRREVLRVSGGFRRQRRGGQLEGRRGNERIRGRMQSRVVRCLCGWGCHVGSERVDKGDRSLLGRGLLLEIRGDWDWGLWVFWMRMMRMTRAPYLAIWAWGVV